MRTRQVRVDLSFVLVYPDELDSIPFTGADFDAMLTHAAQTAARRGGKDLDLLGGAKVTATLVRGRKPHVRTDYTKARAK